MELLGVILVALLLAGGAFYFGGKRNARLESEGRIIKRDGAFFENAETFSSGSVTYDALLQAIQSRGFSDLKANVYPNKGGRSEVLFKSSYEWNALIR